MSLIVVSDIAVRSRFTASLRKWQPVHLQLYATIVPFALSRFQYGEEHMGAKTEYNQFQLFVLAFLMAQEQQQEENGQAFGGPNPNNLPLSHRYITTVSDLSKRVPPSFIPDQPSGKEIVSTIMAHIDELRADGLLKNDPQFSQFREPPDQGFFIAAEGRYYIRKRYQGVTTLIENEQKYEKIIDSLGSDSNSRKYLKGLRKKLLNQTEDKIIGTILSEAVHTAVVSGPIALRFLVELLHQHDISL
ncbi:MAG: hypothetical protein WAJ93_26060 [Candidatus Nitrosopolaris sp.]